MPIASRELTLRNEKDEKKIQIRIFSPETERPGVCGCRYEVDWPEGTHAVTAWGVDSVQALLIAFGMIGAEIYTSDYHKSGNLVWEKRGQGYGFPVSSGLRDLLQGDDAKYL